MGCNCGGKKSGVVWQVTFADGTKTTKDSTVSAHDAGKAQMGAHGGSYSIKAVNG